jgi:cyclic pyranopterin phosphate synthase
MADDDFFKGRALAKAKALKNIPAAPPPAAPLPPEAQGRMVDISAKPAVAREAIAEGFLRLQASTLRALDEGRGPKGDPFPAAQVAGILAAKRTPELVPFCHPIPLAGIDVVLSREAGGVRCRATVRTNAPTGVEMEALAAVTGALLTVWDMTKALEKDSTGQYPGTVIEGVRVLSKQKGAP